MSAGARSTPFAAANQPCRRVPSAAVIQISFACGSAFLIIASPASFIGWSWKIRRSWEKYSTSGNATTTASAMRAIDARIFKLRHTPSGRFYRLLSSLTMAHDKILILDFGAQYTQLIARRVREAKVYCEIHPWDVDDAFVRSFGAKGVILSGSHLSAYDETNAHAPGAVFELGVPVLGICYGMQTMAQQLGGKVEPGKVREFGFAEVRARGHTRLLDGIEDYRTPEGHGMLKVWMSHGDKVVAMPAGFTLMASTEACPIAAMADEKRGYYAVQFHPEVTHTRQGTRILQRFVHEICGCKSDWTMPDYVGEAVARIREQVGKEEVILGLSGGVDSSVAAALIHKAIGDQLTCVFVDHGLLRLDEAKEVMATFAQHMHVKVIHVDASAEFYAALEGVTDPEAKRKIIGKQFVEVFQREAAKVKNAKWLAQGTIYPDVIESAGAKTKKAQNIKSHHNVGGLPESLH